jgi:branched-chain amino acid transport system substrate-binding protein
MGQAKKQILGIIFVLIILIALYFLLQYLKNNTNQAIIKIGFMGPLSGNEASYGESIKRGVDLAVKEMGLTNVEVIYEDSQCKPNEAVNAINKLINIDKVVAIIGEVCSGATLAAAPIAESNKVVMISPASTAPKITEAGDYIFRVVPSDALQGAFGAKLLKDKGYKKLAILYGNEEYGVGFEKVLRENFEKLGGKVVASESFERGTTDLRTQITKIKASKPDALYIISNAPESSVAALRQLKELKVQATIFGSEGLKSDDIIKNAKEAAEGLIVSSVTAGNDEFIKKHIAEYNKEPGPFAAFGYDAFKAIALAIENGAKTSEDIKNALYQLKFDGATGVIDFDDNGDVGGNYDVFIVKNGKFVLEK